MIFTVNSNRSHDREMFAEMAADIKRRCPKLLNSLLNQMDLPDPAEKSVNPSRRQFILILSAYIKENTWKRFEADENDYCRAQDRLKNLT